MAYLTFETVDRVLDRQFATTREIHRRIDCWTEFGVRNVLNEMVRGGRAETRLDLRYGHRPVRLYRKAA